MPIGTPIGKEVKRGTICKDRYRAEVTIMCSSRIPLNQPSPMLVEVKWRQRRDEQVVAGRPESAPVTLTFRSLTRPAHGVIRFDAQNGPEQKGFEGDARQLLTIFGQAATAGAAADVALEVRIDGELRDTIQMSVGDPAPALTVRAENGTSDAPALVLAEEHIRLRAVVTPAAQGTFRWLTFTPTTLEIVGNAQAERAEVVAHRPQGSPPPEGLKLYVLFTAQGNNPVSALATHTLGVAADLEALFTEHVLHPGHLADINFRRRLEALRPPEVRLFLDRASAPPLLDYLTRLTEFVNGQEPLRAAPAGDRPSITFIMGAGDAFYNNATTHFTRVPLGPLVTDLRSLQEVRDYLETHRPGDNRRWGEINIVVHANEEGEMSIPVRPLEPGEEASTHNANPRSLGAAINDDSFRPLPDDLVDVRTVLRIRGCSIGRSQDMVSLLSTAFGGNDAQRPVVRGPRHLQAYSVGGTENPPSDEFYVEFWFVGFPAGARPSDPAIVDMFEAQFPGVNVDWAAALTHPGVPFGEQVVNETRTRRYLFNFVRNYRPEPADNQALAQLLQQAGHPDASGRNHNITDRTPNPDGTTNIVFEFDNASGAHRTDAFIVVGPGPPTTQAERLRVLRQHQPTMDDLARIGLTPDDYTWNFPPVTPDVQHPDGRGARRWTLSGEGRRTIRRVQRQLREADPERAGRTRRMHPAVTDLTYFAEEVPAREPAHPPGENVAPPAPATP